MELRSTREMHHSEQLTRTTARKAETPNVAAKTQVPRQQATADKMTLSRQALAFLEEQDRKRWEKAQEELQRNMARSNEILDGLENAKNQSDAMADSLKVLLLCQKIAASIIKGNHVPPEDEQYLLEHDMEGYQMAMALRRQNPDPEDEDSVLEDEDQEAGSAEGAESAGGDVSAPAVEAAAPASGGGDASPAAE